MPGRSWRAGKAIVAMESPKALMCPLEKGVRGIDIGASEEKKEFSSSLSFHYIPVFDTLILKYQGPRAL